MNKQAVWSLALILTSGSLIGCTRTARKVAVEIAGGREIAQSRQDLLKPSPCIKWDDASARSTRPPKKIRGASVGKNPQKT
jgi:hypothetical protein